MRILCVDDKEINREILVQMLSPGGHEVIEAESGLKALDILGHSSIDLILMDIMMPGMDGRETTRHIKKKMGERYVPVIFVTALNRDMDLQQALNAGGDDFISKPVNMQVLESKIQAHARIKQLNDQLVEANKKLSLHNAEFEREQELVQFFFENAKKQSYLEPEFIRYHLSPMSMFNGDVLLVAKRPAGGVYVLLGDFTGHGLRASMGTLPITQSFMKMTEKGCAVSDIAFEINHHLERLLPIDMFLAAIIMEIPAGKGHIVVWAGGLPAAYIVDANATTVIKSTHMPLGILKDAEFENTVTLYPITPQQRIYLCTDGIVEAAKDNKEIFGEERLEKLMVTPTAEIFDKVMLELKHFCHAGKQHDDISFIEICRDNLVKQYSLPEIDYSQSYPFQLSLCLQDEQLRTLNPVPQWVASICQQAVLRPHKDALVMLLTELYSNALEHGVLQLEGRDKMDDSGFIDYYQRKATALSELQSGKITVDLNYTPSQKGGKLTLRIQDSGKGFEYKHRTSTFDNPGGRGLMLVSSMCESITVDRETATVQAVYCL